LRCRLYQQSLQYSGAASPGATLVIEIYNAMGVKVGSRSLIVDVGGNWLAVFPSAKLLDFPQTVVITERPAASDDANSTGYNLRAYFSPALNAGSFFRQELTPSSATANTGQNVVNNNMLEGNTNQLRLTGRKYNYQMLSSLAGY
jgi:hypothetical protein